MNREDIYDHLAQVYLGKRKQADIKKKKQFNAWLVINIFITVTIFAGVFYGLTAFLTQKGSTFEKNVIYSLHQGSIRVEYNFNSQFPPVQTFSLSLSSLDASKYNKIQFALRGKEEGAPGVIKVVVRNDKGEISSYYVQGIGLGWGDYSIPLSEFKQISDWSNIIDVSFVLESWNVVNKKGVVLIDDVNFSS